MQSRNKSIVQNLVSHSGGKVLSYFLTFLSITIAARHLGVEDFGLFTSSLALVTIIAKFIDFGFSQIVFRETARTKKFDHITNALSLRLVFSLPIFLILNLIIIIVNLSFKEIILINLLFVNIYISSRFTNIRELLEIRFKVDLKMHLVMICSLIDNILLLGFVILMIFANGDLYFFVIVYVLSNLPGFVFIIYLLFKNYAYKFNFLINKWKWLIKESLPLFVLVLILAIHQQLDIIYLKYSDSTFSAGIYSAALRLTMPLSILPIAFASTFFPLIVEKLETRETNIQKIINIIYKTIFLISIFPFLLVVFKSKEITLLFFGNSFLKAFEPLIVLFGANIFLFSIYFSLDLCTMYKKQYISLYYALIILITNVIGLYFLVNGYSYMGAAYSKIISVLLGWIFITFVSIKFKILKPKFRLRYLFWVASIFIIAYAFSSLNLYIFLLATTISFSIFTISLGYYDEDELKVILEKINRIRWLPILRKILLFR